MRIVQILNTGFWSAAADYCVTVSKELDKRGHEVLIITQPGKALDRIKMLNLDYDSSISLNHRNPVLFVQAIKRMKYIYRTFKPDIISPHMNEAAWLPGFVSKQVYPSAKVVRIRTEYDPPKKHFINQIVHQRYIDHLIVGSKLHDRLCRSILNYDADKISVVYGAVDTDTFNPSLAQTTRFRHEKGISSNDVLIGLLARLDPVKGHEYALAAVAALKDLQIPFKLVIIGYEAGLTYHWIKNLAEQMGIADKIICAGYCKNLPDVLGSIDIGLISSIGSEANSRASLELMATGKPIVATSVGVIPEIIQDSEQGIIVSPQNPEKLAVALKTLIIDPILRHKMGVAARQKALQHFSLDRFGSHMEAVYSKVIKK